MVRRRTAAKAVVETVETVARTVGVKYSCPKCGPAMTIAPDPKGVHECARCRSVPLKKKR